MALAERCCHGTEDATYHQHFQDKMILVGRFQSVILYNIKGERRHLSDKRQHRCAVTGKSVGLCSVEALSTRAEISGHLSCQSQPSLATNNTNKRVLSSTAIALWLGTIFL